MTIPQLIFVAFTYLFGYAVYVVVKGNHLRREYEREMKEWEEMDK